MNINIFSKQFFSNYIFHPHSKELTKLDQRKALATSIFLGIFTLGICHIVCLIKYRNQKFTLIKEEDSPTAQKVNQETKKIIQPEKQWSFDELMNSNELTAKEMFDHAKSEYNVEKSHKLMLKAAAMGSVEAMKEAGDNYHYGRNDGDNKVLPDSVEAVKWYKKAAQGKNPKACEALANIYLLGKDVPKDIQEAKKWVTLVFEYGGTHIIFLDTKIHTITRNLQFALEYIDKLNQN